MLKRALGLVALGVVGAVVAAVGSGSYRSMGYVGVVLAVLLVAAAGLFAKAWHAWMGFAAYGAVWVVTAFLFAQQGPGGSVLIPRDDVHASLWLYGAGAALAVVAAVPPFVLTGRDVTS